MNIKPLFAAILLILALAGCGPSTALVHVTYPKEFEIEARGLLVGDGAVSLNLPPGRQTLFFRHGGDLFAAVLDVQSGGEIYTSLEREDLCRVKSVAEMR